MTENQPEDKSGDLPSPYSRFFFIDESGRISSLSSIKDGLAAVDSGGYLWLDYCDPDLADLEPLITDLHLHPLSIEDVLNEDQLPKLDLFPNYSFIIFNIFESTLDEVFTHELDLFIGSNFIITATKRDLSGQPLLAGIERAVERESQRIKKGPSFLLHLIIDNVVDHKFQAIDQIENKLDQDEDKILGDSRDFDLSRLLDSRRALSVMRKSVFYEREVLSKLIRKDSPFISDKAIIFFRDIYDHLALHYEITETARDQVTSLMEIRLSMISNRMAQTSNHTNAIMRRLTLITTIFMPLTLIAGIGGMSEFTMMIGNKNILISYLILFLAMALIALINYYFLKRMERGLNEEE
ncbi:MAG: magnesium transporter CorA family protein [Anaerolineaceae bacterium]|jgi:magnesium transporter|nr:magnesium transporter CorA family protein [Chloroflexota bacterium]HZK17562.1 magnesium transporter CorA family protein [Anaerolineaceae bacterium]